MYCIDLFVGEGHDDTSSLRYRELQYALLVSFKTITQSTWGVYRQQNYLLLPPLDQQLKLQENVRF